MIKSKLKKRPLGLQTATPFSSVALPLVKKDTKGVPHQRRVILQNHHVLYENKEKKVKAVTRKIRKGVHQAISLLRRFNYLTDQEISTITLESELKRVYDEKT